MAHCGQLDDVWASNAARVSLPATSRWRSIARTPSADPLVVMFEFNEAADQVIFGRRASLGNDVVEVAGESGWIRGGRDGELIVGDSHRLEQRHA